MSTASTASVLTAAAAPPIPSYDPDEDDADDEHERQHDPVRDRDVALPPQRDEPERPDLAEEDPEQRERLHLEDRRRFPILLVAEQHDRRLGEHDGDEHEQERDGHRRLGHLLQRVAETLPVLGAGDREQRQRDGEHERRDPEQDLEDAERGREEAGLDLVGLDGDEDHEQSQVDDVHRERRGERQRLAQQLPRGGALDRGPHAGHPDDEERREEEHRRPRRRSARRRREAARRRRGRARRRRRASARAAASRAA